METRTSVQFQAHGGNHHSHNHRQQQKQQHYRAAMNKSSSRNSEPPARPESPLRFHSPLRSETESPPYASPAASLERLPFPETSKAIVAVDKQTQCSPSPLRPTAQRETRDPGAAGDGNAQPAARKAAFAGGGEDGKSAAVTTILRRSRARDVMKRAMLGARVLEAAICMSSFAVMAADKTQGWSGDSFDRYTEYKFCLSVNVIGFIYSGFQACTSAHHLITGKHVIREQLRCRIEFSMDQILSYLLISASSAAATRVDDWETNWGKDQFTEMASASIALAFLAFLAFAFSSLLSGYNLWTRDFT